MFRLQTVYLANVVLYINSIERILKFKMINKKCNDATIMVRYFSKRRVKEDDDENDRESFVVPTNLFDIFPNIETIECDEVDTQNISKNFKQIKQIKLTVDGIDDCLIPTNIKEKVISLKLYISNLHNCHLNDYVKLRTLFFTHEDGNIKNFLGDFDFPLKRITVESRNAGSLLVLKEYNRIEEKVIILKTNEMGFVNEELMEELSSFATIKFNDFGREIDVKNTFVDRKLIELYPGIDIDKIYNNYLFTSCNVAGKCDLRRCTFLESVQKNAFNDNATILVEGLTNLKEICCVREIDCIPWSVTRFCFDENFDLQQLIKKDGCWLKNIKEVEFVCHNYADRLDSSMFLHFCNCKNLRINDNTRINNFHFPESLTELKVFKCVCSQLKEISKLKTLKELYLLFEPNKILLYDSQIQLFQEMVNKMTSVECLTTDFPLQQIRIPSNITKLDTTIYRSSDLTKYNNLKKLKISPNYRDRIIIEVELPICLEYLEIHGSIVVINSCDISVKELVFYSTPSQSLMWNCKKVTIKN